MEKILDREFEIWKEHYNNEHMRHLFIEVPYYTAEFLNVWMLSDNDDILDEVYGDWEGSLIYVPCVREFYRNIKRDCPETVFHGTDVGHQSETIGVRFLRYLVRNGLKDSEQYSLTRENMDQGELWYRRYNNISREITMTKNFIREFDKLNGENVMGIYGAAHTDPNGTVFGSDTAPNMAAKLQKRYGEALRSEDLTWLIKAD